jgi:hypothetical protein
MRFLSNEEATMTLEMTESRCEKGDWLRVFEVPVPFFAQALKKSGRPCGHSPMSRWA